MVEAPEPKGRKPGRRWRRLVAFYLVALVISHLVRFFREDPVPAGTGPSVIEVAAVGDEDAEPVRFAYLEWGAADAERPVVLLIHGSPGDAANFDRLGPLLAERFRVIAPDLPGFGDSSRDVPDYSILSHARYCLELMRRLDVAEAHVVGFSMGGGVALHLEELAPERVRSAVMLSAIGVQELELLGQYHLNHAIHGAQVAGLWLLHEATPHFGALDGSMLDLSYARNFYDTDQRPLRLLLERFDKPMLIIHGEHDVLVPYAAALEHHRLVPQSELETFDANHFMVFASPRRLAAPLLGFFGRVEAGEAVVRVAADPERLRAAADEAGFQPRRTTGLALVVALVLIAFATLASEDLTCIATGLLVARGTLGFTAGTVACAAGIFFGDLMLYGLGRLGRPGLGRAPLKWFVSPQDVARSTRWFQRRGALVVLVSRFVPGMRLPTYVAAGLLRTNIWWFAINLLIPVALWTPLLVGLGRIVGDRFFDHFEVFQRYALPGFAGLMLSIWLLLSLGRSLASYRGRRLLVGWWHRRQHWEFWPRWAFYPPVVVFVLWQALRHRSLTLFTAANPGIPAAGGFHGESKAEILERLGGDWSARFRLIPESSTPAEKRAAVADFMAEIDLSLPIVLKPDQGLRGVGVAVVEDESQVAPYFREPRGDVIVQEYVGGPELGVFYVRLPGDDRGRIISITEKVRPVVVGDGRSTVERLILADGRAVALAKVYFKAQAGQLDRVPAVGERVQLIEVGSHSGGVICLDGARYGTQKLEEAIERVARGYNGFYFGRLDLRAPSEQSLLDGRDFKVLEINGVTSEATHIYDRKYSLWQAYGVLFEQWRLAFEVGARNRDRGVRPASVGELVRLLLGSGRRPSSWGAGEAEASPET
ncbi:MAG: alpha/beta fold hydrolase [bacterium]|nr:alpha/beta fold hydrolase [bacterium]